MCTTKMNSRALVHLHRTNPCAYALHQSPDQLQSLIARCVNMTSATSRHNPTSCNIPHKQGLCSVPQSEGLSFSMILCCHRKCKSLRPNSRSNTSLHPRQP